MRWMVTVLVLTAGCAQGGPGGPAENAAPPPAAAGVKVARRVIETAWLELRVQNLEAATSTLQAEISAVEGYISDSQIRPSAHSGRWTIRVPEDRLEPFLNSARALGSVMSSRSTAEDVTEQFIDVEARIKTKQTEEARLLKLLEQSTGSLADVLAVEQQLHRVREEIEQIQGRLRYLEHSTRFATVHIDAHELFGESWTDDRPLMQHAAMLFRDSCSALLRCGRAVVLVTAALLPWGGVAAAIAFPTWLLLRRRSIATSRFNPR